MADHRFVPTIYHTTLGPHDPVLTIESGDRVFTTTVDAGGFDANDIAVTPGGNPQTGPFRVAGAEAGDTLAVHLEQIRPNRARGYTKTWVAPNVLDPGHPTLPGDLPPSIDWTVDAEAGVASPLGVPELAHWRVPLAPMIGCFGVAPERHQAISTATSVLGIAGGVGGSRVVRGAVVATKGNDYFLAAKAVGAPTTQILVRHVLPNIVAPLIIIFSINVGGVILAEASLSFLGFGLPIKVPSWGGMLSREGRRFMEQAPWLALWPGLGLTIVVYSFNMLGDAMRDLLDPAQGWWGTRGYRCRQVGLKSHQRTRSQRSVLHSAPSRDAARGSHLRLAGGCPPLPPMCEPVGPSARSLRRLHPSASPPPRRPMGVRPTGNPRGFTPDAR